MPKFLTNLRRRAGFHCQTLNLSTTSLPQVYLHLALSIAFLLTYFLANYTFIIGK